MDFEQYEFSNSQNELIKNLAEKMRFVGLFLIIGGALALLGGILALRQGGLGNIFNGVFYIILGFWTQKAASSFKMIVDTQGHDVENLMGALGELRKLYALQYWLLIVLLIFLALTIVLSLIAGIARVGR